LALNNNHSKSELNKDPGLGQAQKCSDFKLVNRISNLLLGYFDIQ